MEWYLLGFLFVAQLIYFFGFGWKCGANEESISGGRVLNRYGWIGLTTAAVMFLDWYYGGFLTVDKTVHYSRFFAPAYYLVTLTLMILVTFVGHAVGSSTIRLGKQYLCIDDD